MHKMFNEDDRIIKKTFNLTRDWFMSDWSDFRDSTYWSTKDRIYKNYYNPKTRKFNNYAYSKWVRWRYDYLIAYLKNKK